MGTGTDAFEMRPPTHWTPQTTGEADIAFRHRDGRFRVEATRTDESVDRPGLCLPGGWKLTCRQRLGETTYVRSLGHATTRTAAADALRESMESIDSALERGEARGESALAAAVGALDSARRLRPESADHRFG